MKIIIATKNKNKIKEIKNKFNRIPDLTVVDISSYPDIPDVEETGSTFMENALLKARAITAYTGIPSLADDSGLVVDALGGRPGIFSARYGGEGLTDHDRNMLLLEEMKDVPHEARKARFICSIILYMPDDRYYSAEGQCEGLITESPKGERGFGYDPIFYLPDHHCTMAELDLDEKNRISHRARALDNTAEILKDLV
ncbi:MAG TPA: XTP/dITP diphosphatase [Spirochaetota bacterium]|nr:XTP/dITP diphosphatase [Spirochaetota bacterium]HPI90255.1 XTP/dITP diphosphatase [Spirochaetota bacterium]HPR46504.1 XTP/dITP diphosphatase [Spirochaetota bacterium]